MEAARLRADGVPIPSTDGEAVLRIDMLALSLLEEDWGSIDDAQQALRAALTDPLSAGAVRVLGSFLRAGLATPGDIPTPHQALATVECSLIDGLDLCASALVQAFPPVRAEGNAEADGASTGAAGTTAPPSAGAAPTTSGGG